MSETRKLAAILVADVVGYSRLAGADEERVLARLRTLRSDVIDPTIAVHRGRVVKRVGDGAIVEFRSAVDAVRCAVEIENTMAERNADVPEEKRIVFRIGVHVGDVVEEADGDLMGDCVNIATRLQGVAKPGAICLSEDAYRQVKTRLDLRVSDLGATTLKNIAEPVRVFAVETASRAAAARFRSTLPRRWRLAGLAGAMALMLLIFASGYVLLGRDGIAPEPAHLSMVVLPFANLSGDPSQDYFADGITENLTTDLSRIRKSFVIAPSTAFAFKGKPADAKAIGKAVGVRYVVAGSVERNKDRVRVNVELVDTATGSTLWAARFEEDLADLLKLQDEIVGRIGNALGIELVKAEAKSGRTDKPDAIDLTMRGWTMVWQGIAAPLREKQGAYSAARALFDQALAVDPDYPDALAGDAYTYLADYEYAWGAPGADYEAKILDRANGAIAAAPDDWRGYYPKAAYLRQTRRFSEALRTADLGLEADPNAAELYGVRSAVELSLGQCDRAKQDALAAIGLSPRDPQIGSRHAGLGNAELCLGDMDAAVAEYHKATDLGYRNTVGLAAVYALQGKTEEAKLALAKAREAIPKLCIKCLVGRGDDFPALLDGLRKAGLPEE